jgi:mono/diheme cytochrome c family protein
VTSQACTPALDGAALYTASCARCHGPLATSNLKGRNISLALIQQFGMQQGLTDAQLQAIVTAVGP